MLDSLIIYFAQYLYWLVALIALVYFFSIPKNQKINLGILIIIALPCIYLTSKLLANLYFDPRPFVTGHFIPLIPHTPDNGFPSDHALLTSAIASVIFVYNKKIGALLWLLAFIVGAARVMAGVHHIIDIIGAFIISILVTAAIHYLLKKQRIFLYQD